MMARGLPNQAVPIVGGRHLLEVCQEASLRRGSSALGALSNPLHLASLSEPNRNHPLW